MVYFDQLMHLSARNDQFAFHTFLMAPETDLATFTTVCVHYGRLISFCFSLCVCEVASACVEVFILANLYKVIINVIQTYLLVGL